MRKSILVVVFLSACQSGVGRVGSRTIGEKEFDAYLRLKNLDNVDAQRRQSILDQFLEREALAQAVEKSGKLEGDLIAAELEEHRREVLISRYFEKVLREAVSDDAVRAYYTAHAGEFEEKKVHVAHILVRANPAMSETERQARLTTAREAYDKIRVGAEFAKVAAEYSEDTVSAKKGGDLGWLKEGAIDPELSRRAFALQEGEVTEPFMTPFGFHVLKHLEGPQTAKKSFEEVAGEIRYRMRNETKDVETKRLLAGVPVKRKG